MGASTADFSDPLVGVAGFAHALAAAGLPVTSDSVQAFTRALRQVDMSDPLHVYWAGRATLCRSPDDIGPYDLTFENWFGGTVLTSTPQRGQRPRRARIAALTATGATPRHHRKATRPRRGSSRIPTRPVSVQ